MFLATLGAEELRIEASFCKAIRIAKEQKSVSLEKRAEATYAEYCRQKRARQEDADFACLFANFLQLPCLLFNAPRRDILRRFTAELPITCGLSRLVVPAGNLGGQQKAAGRYSQHDERSEMMIIRLPAQWAFFFPFTGGYTVA